MSRNKNLTYDERCIIQKGIHECANKRATRKTIGNVNIIVNEILIVHAMLHLSAKEEINLPELVMDAVLTHTAGLTNILTMPFLLTGNTGQRW